MRVLQLSDLHVLSDVDAIKNGIAPAAALRAIVDVIEGGPPPDFVVLTGDLIHDDKAQSYAFIAEALAPLSTPTIAVCGNHDISALRSVFPFPADAAVQPITEDAGEQRGFVIEREQWRLFFLDSQVPGEVGGDVDREQLRWFDNELSRSDKNAICFVHHPPAPVGVEWIDAHGVIGPEFAEICARHSSTLRSIFFGHVHGHYALNVGGVPALSCPSTAYGFGDAEYTRVKHFERPFTGGFRVIDLLPKDHLRSRVVVVSDADAPKAANA